MDYRKVMQLGLMPLSRTRPKLDGEPSQTSDEDSATCDPVSESVPKVDAERAAERRDAANKAAG